jgi:ABC-2 type transport system permease protein
VAGLNESGASVAAAMHAGPLSALARSQYRALAAMRWSIFRNSLRSTQGVFELGARTVAFVFYALMGLLLATGLGGGTYAIAASEKWELLPIVFWGVFLIWQIVPVSLASFQEQFDLGALLRFPVGFGPFFLLHLIFGLVDASTILGTLCCAGIWIGIILVRPDLFAVTAAALAVFAAFNVLLVRAVSAWVDRWLAQRRTREIVGALFLLGLLSLQLLNPAFRPEKHSRMSAQSRAEGMRWLKAADSVQRWLPPGLAALAVERGSTAKPEIAIEATALLGLYALAAGAVMGVRLRAEYRGENLSDAPSSKKEERRAGGSLIDGSGPIAAVIEKELRTVMRSMPLLYGLAAPLLMVFVLSALFVRSGPAAGQTPSMGLMVGLAYAIVGFTQLFYNNLGPEGVGIQVLFLAPTPVRTVILAKNLFHALLFLVDAALVCVVASLRMGWPAPASLAVAWAWLLFALPVHLAAGNLFSLNMPYRMNLGRITRQRGSQASALFSMLIQIAVLGVGVGTFVFCSYLGDVLLAVPVFLLLAAAATIAWIRVLGNVDRIANQRRETLIATLARTE